MSAASAWEITSKARIHAQRAGSLPGHHQDPWDRMLIAQAQAEGLTLVTSETTFDQYGITRVW